MLCGKLAYIFVSAEDILAASGMQVAPPAIPLTKSGAGNRGHKVASFRKHRQDVELEEATEDEDEEEEEEKGKGKEKEKPKKKGPSLEAKEEETQEDEGEDEEMDEEKEKEKKKKSKATVKGKATKRKDDKGMFLYSYVIYTVDLNTF